MHNLVPMGCGPQAVGGLLMPTRMHVEYHRSVLHLVMVSFGTPCLRDMLVLMVLM